MPWCRHVRRVGADSHVAERVLSQFLAEMDGIEELKGVLVLAATNRLDMLDPAVLRPGRFDEIVELGLPDEQARADIFEVHLRNKPIASGISPRDLASRTANHTGADIYGLCTRAARRAVCRAIEAEKGEPGTRASVIIEAEDFDSALQEVPVNAAIRKQRCTCFALHARTWLQNFPEQASMASALSLCEPSPQLPRC